MEISGKIIQALEPRSGTSARTGNKWMSQEYVIETHEQYPKRCVFRVFGEDKIKNMNIQVGEEVTVSFDIDAREYNGRWYNDISAWRVTRGGEVPAATDPTTAAALAATQPVAPSPAAQAPQAPAGDSGTVDELPPF